MLEELQRRNFAPTTISSYLHAVEQFARHFKCRPDRLNQTHFRSYQAYLLHERSLGSHFNEFDSQPKGRSAIDDNRPFYLNRGPANRQISERIRFDRESAAITRTPCQKQFRLVRPWGQSNDSVLTPLELSISVEFRDSRRIELDCGYFDSGCNVTDVLINGDADGANTFGWYRNEC
jgi:hypothetical protein